MGGRGASGDPFKSIECYDIRRDKWFSVADMSTKRRHVGVVSFGGDVIKLMRFKLFIFVIMICINIELTGRLYAVGGHDGYEHLGSGEMFDPVKNSWTPIAAMNTLRCDAEIYAVRIMQAILLQVFSDAG